MKRFFFQVSWGFIHLFFFPSGIVMSDVAIYESLESAGVYGSLGAPSPASLRAICGTDSTSSSISALSATTTEDDPFYQTCIFQGDRTNASNDELDSNREKGQGGRQRLLRPASELFASAKTTLSRSASTRSYLRTPAGSAPSSGPNGEKQQCGGFSGLQRKPKQKSIRRRLLKYIPGLKRPIEEEESKLWETNWDLETGPKTV